MNKLNIKIFYGINNLAGENLIFDKFMIVLAEYLLFVFILFLLFLWLKKKEKRNFVLYSGYSAVTGIFLNFIIRLFYFHPRPFMENNGKILINHSPETSFPSDHTTFMLSIAFIFLYFKETRKIGIFLSISGIIGGIARVYCGVHYPFDILGSILVAGVSSYIIFLSRGKLKLLNKFFLNLSSRIRI